MRLINADALMEYARNQKDGTIDCNDIARFPTAQPERKTVLMRMGNGDILSIGVDDVQLERKTGRWIDQDPQSYTWHCKCSECGKTRSMMSTQGQYPRFCENCGAEMVGGEE